MGDITYENLIMARKASKTTDGEFDIMGMANIALKIMEQAAVLKGQGGILPKGGTLESRSEPIGASKPIIDVDQILGALTTVKSLKGDIKITELQKLLKDNKETISGMLSKLG